MNILCILNLNQDEILEAELYPHPVMLLDKDYKIVYKNSASKSAGLKPRLGSSIVKYMDSSNIKMMHEANKKKEFKILKLSVQSNIRRFVFHPGGESLKAVIFYKTFNFIKDGCENENEIIESIEKIIYCYYEKEQQVKTRIAQTDGGVFYGDNYKKISRVTEHFVKHMDGLNPRNISKNKNYCDIAIFLNNFTSGISQYIHPFGYKIICNIEDKMFFYRLNEDDLLLINFILSALSFKYSVFNKIDIRFFSDFNSGILRYEFKTSNDFLKEHESMFVKDYLTDINGIEYLDMNLAALVAKNNGLKLNAYYEADRYVKVFFELIFDSKKTELNCPISAESGNHITAEKIKEKAAIGLAGIFK